MKTATAGRREEGMALIVVVMLLALIGAMVPFAVSHSGSELAGSARTRGAARALYAADAGIQIALGRLADNPPTTTPLDVTLSGWSIQSRTRTESSAAALNTDGSFGPPPEGYGIEDGYRSDIYRVNITSSRQGLGSAELEAKLTRLSSSVGGY